MGKFLGLAALFGFLGVILGAPIVRFILVKRAKDKYREGIRTGLGSVEELMELLRRLQCSFVKEIYYDETGNVALKTKWGKHTLLLQDGIVNTNPQEFDSIYSSDKMILERNTLFQYILKELDHAAPVNAYKYYSTGKRLVQLYQWTPRVFWLGVIIFLVVFASRLFGDKAISGVKNGHPQLYPDVTYGEAFDFFFNSGEWSSFTSENDRKVVEFKGKIGGKEKESTVLFQFLISEDNESFTAEYMEIDGLGLNDWMAGLCILAIFEDYEDGKKGDSSEAVEEFWNDIDDASDVQGSLEEEDVQLSQEETAENMELEKVVQAAVEPTALPANEQEADASLWETTYYRSRGPYCTLLINHISDTEVNFTIGCGASGYLAYCDFRGFPATITSQGTAVYEGNGWSLTLNFQNDGLIIVEESGEVTGGVSLGGIYVSADNWFENYYEYVFPHSDSQYITAEEMEGLTKEDCRIARNEIYARHGRRFSDEVLQAYFETCSWYYGYISPEEFDDNVLNDVERYNIEMIKAYEEG